VREALEQNRKAAALQPRNLKALYNIGAVYANMGANDSAEVYWSRVISIDADDDMAKQAEANIRKLHGDSQKQ
jgi:precorrin-6B methylase 2